MGEGLGLLGGQDSIHWMQVIRAFETAYFFLTPANSSRPCPVSQGGKNRIRRKCNRMSNNSPKMN